MTVTDSMDPAVAGLCLSYTLSTTNNGPSDASGVTVTDTLPTSTTFLGSVPGSPTCTHSSGTVTCSLGQLAASAVTDVTVTVLVDSGAFSSMTSAQAFDAIAADLSRCRHGKKQVHFRLRDWGVSRQRYWGAPIPIIYCDDCDAVPVPEEDLPVVLPEDVSFMGVQSPIKADPEWRKTTCPECGQPAERAGGVPLAHEASGTERQIPYISHPLAVSRTGRCRMSSRHRRR